MSFADNIRVAVAGGGLLLAGATFVAGNFSGEQLRPVDRIEDVVPASPSEKPCPDGWKNNSVEADHTVIKSCEKDGWMVILDPQGAFSHGYQPNVQGAAFVFDPLQVPGWPR